MKLFFTVYLINNLHLTSFNIVKVITLYEFEGDAATGELSFVTGEIIIVTNKVSICWRSIKRF